jgi:aspartyl-tRNA(Asn)/glutamyl-tRNA(Gln) amidotransferase subunit B
LLPAIINNNAESIAALASQLNIIQTGDAGQLQEWVNTVINKMPEKVAEYKKGKKGLIGLFVGEVKKLSKGRADLKSVTQLLEDALKS